MSKIFKQRKPRPLGLRPSAETRKKLSKAQQGKKHSFVTRAKMSEAQMQRWARERGEDLALVRRAIEIWFRHPRRNG